MNVYYTITKNETVYINIIKFLFPLLPLCCISFSTSPNLGLYRSPKCSLHKADGNIIIINKYLSFIYTLFKK